MERGFDRDRLAGVSEPERRERAVVGSDVFRPLDQRRPAGPVHAFTDGDPDASERLRKGHRRADRYVDARSAQHAREPDREAIGFGSRRHALRATAVRTSSSTP